MSTENIQLFNERVSEDSALADKFVAAQEEAAKLLADRLAALSAEAGVPFTAEEYLQAVTDEASGELSDEELSSASGGVRATITLTCRCQSVKAC